MAKPTTPSAAGAVVRSLSPQDTKKLLHLVRNAKSIEIKVSVPMAAHQRTGLSMGSTRSRRSCGRCTSSTRPTRPESGRAHRPGPAHPGGNRRPRWSSCARSTRRDQCRAQALGHFQGRGGRHAGRNLHVLGVVQGRCHRPGRARRHRWHEDDPFAVLQGATRLLRRPRSRGRRHELPADPGPDPRAQGQAPAKRVQARQ